MVLIAEYVSDIAVALSNVKRAICKSKGKERRLTNEIESLFRNNQINGCLGSIKNRIEVFGQTFPITSIRLMVR